MIIREAPCSLVLPVLFWISGLVAGIYFQIPVVLLFVIILFNLAILIITKYDLKLLLVFIFFLAILRINLADYKPANHLQKILSRHTQVKAELEGIVERVVTIGYKSNLYQVKATKLAGEPVKGRIYLRADSGLSAGTGIKGAVILEKPEGVRNPGHKDRRFLNKVRGINGIGKTSSELEINNDVKPGLTNRILNWIEKRLTKRLGKAGEFALAITTGKTSGIDWEFREKIRGAGLSHLFAVSGLHVGIIAFMIYSLLMVIFPSRATRLLLLLLLVIYGFLCHWSASVSRAVLMLGVYSFCHLLERPVNLNQILLFSLLVITMLAPYQAFSAGLQLSFAATLVIINLAPLLEWKLFRRRSGKLVSAGKRMIQTVMLTLAVVIFIIPLSLANFGEFSANGMISIIPASLLFGLLLPLALTIIILPWGWEPFAASFRFLLHLFQEWTGITAGLPLYFRNIKFYFWQAVIIYILFLGARFCIRRRLKITAIILIIMIPVIFLIPQIRLEKRGYLEINCLDCGQGDLSFIKLAEGETILIDTGPPETEPGTASESLLPWLSYRGISELDYVIITHAHNDHYGGLPAIFRALRVKFLITGADFWNDLEDAEIKRLISEENIEIKIISDTLSFYLGKTRLQFLHPDNEYETENQNNKSLVVRLIYGEFEGLFTGDIEESAENQLLANYCEYLDSDFLKAPHHGSITSNTESFIEAVSPEICFIPAGKNNRFKFPHRSVIERYEFLGDHLVISGKEGALLMRTDGMDIECEVMLRDSVFWVNAVK